MNTTSTKFQTIWLVVIGFLIVAWSVSIQNKNGNVEYNVRHIDSQEAYARLNSESDVLIVDVRDKDAYDKEHIPNAMAIPIDDLSKRMGELETHKTGEIIVYCNEGSNRGPRATQQLNNAGFQRAVNLKGGLQSWKSAKFQTVKP